MRVTPTCPHIIIVARRRRPRACDGVSATSSAKNHWWHKKKAQISLIEKSRTHIWKPLLHEIAAGSMGYGAARDRVPGAGATGTGSSSATAR
ncbi:MAG: hypothetical protein WDN31_14945 [Hyphomicrobium sp.]